MGDGTILNALRLRSEHLQRNFVFYICFFGTTAVVPKELSHEGGAVGSSRKNGSPPCCKMQKGTAMHLHSSPLEIIVTDASP